MYLAYKGAPMLAHPCEIRGCRMETPVIYTTRSWIGSFDTNWLRLNKPPFAKSKSGLHLKFVYNFSNIWETELFSMIFQNVI